MAKCGNPNCSWCDWEGVAAIVAMSESAVAPERGDQVRVSFDAQYAGRPNPLGGSTGKKHMVKVAGEDGMVRETWVPAGAKITVLEKFVPEEPAQGSVIEFSNGKVYAHWANYRDYGWIEVNKTGTGNTVNWAQMVKENGSKFEPWANVRPY